MRNKITTVFISYSHDSDSHKEWVLELATRLQKNGVNVILDQWDLGFGDDVPKFMEAGVSKTDRVLMICTETYVTKADEGHGGVGYEAMIVTGELVQDLGTNKFIPIVRQENSSVKIPKSVSTRKWVNLSESADFEKEFEELLRELHQSPASPKPPLGPNPYKDGNFERSGAPAAASEQTQSIYYAAINSARDGDTARWRRSVREAWGDTSHGIGNWRSKYDGELPASNEAGNTAVLEGLDVFEDVFAIALAGIESGQGAFTQQIGALEELLLLPDWNRSGTSFVVDFPDTVAFVYQALTGALYLSTNQLSTAIRMGKARLPSGSSTSELYAMSEITVCPNSLGRNITTAWNFLVGLPNHWTWLQEPFGAQDEYVSGLTAYYMALSVLELAFTLVKNDENILDEKLRLELPPVYMAEEYRIQRKGYRLLISDPDQVRSIWRDLDISDDTFNLAWPKWMKHTFQWHRSVVTFPDIDAPIQSDLPSEL